jgi:hypothetical protein
LKSNGLRFAIIDCEKKLHGAIAMKIYTSKDVETSMSNVFGLQDPQRFSCSIWAYSAGLSRMVIRVSEREDLESAETMYLTFESVRYFEGPVAWSGANFCTGTSIECADILTDIGFADIPRNELLDILERSTRLYIVRVINRSVKLIASKVSVTEETPVLFSDV